MRLPFLALEHTMLLNLFLNVTNELKETVLVYHDESFDVSFIIANLVKKRDVIVATPLHRPLAADLRKPRSTILCGKSPKALVSTLRRWPLWNPFGHVIAVAETSDDARKWIISLWKLTRVGGATVIVLSDPLSFYSWLPYQRGECLDVQTVVQYKTKEELPQQHNLFNLNGCPLFLVSSYAAPAVIDDTRGMEPRLLYSIAHKLNLTIVYRRLEANQSLWLRFDNGVPINAMLWLWENYVDLMFGDLACFSLVRNHAECLNGHHVVNMAFFVPAPTPISHTTAFYSGLSVTMWCLTFLVFLSLIFIEMCYSYLNKKHVAVFPMNSVSLLLNISSLPYTSTSMRLLIIFGYFFSIHLTTFYQSFLIIFLSAIPHEKAITTWEELASSDLKFVYFPEHKYLLTESTSTALQTLAKSSKSIPEMVVSIEKVAQRKYAALGPELAFLYEMQNESFFDAHDYPLVLLIPQTLYMAPMTIYMSSGHILVPTFNRYLQWLIEAGFPQHYLRENVVKHKALAKRNTVFKVEHLLGAFIVLGYGLLTAICIFLLETLCFKSKWVTKSRK